MRPAWWRLPRLLRRQWCLLPTWLRHEQPGLQLRPASRAHLRLPLLRTSCWHGTAATLAPAAAAITAAVAISASSSSMPSPLSSTAASAADIAVTVIQPTVFASVTNGPAAAACAREYRRRLLVGMWAEWWGLPGLLRGCRRLLPAWCRSRRPGMRRRQRRVRKQPLLHGGYWHGTAATLAPAAAAITAAVAISTSSSSIPSAISSALATL